VTPVAPEPLSINGVEVPPGRRASVELPVASLYTATPMTMPVQVVHGHKPGPRLLVCAAIHGDELNGVEIIRRLLALKALKRLRGALIAIPIVNVYGVVTHSRYLPDRRDLNRFFPGSEKGSLTARLARLLLDEVLAKCTHCVDLHTGALHRDNLPHVRADLDDPVSERLARAFGVPVLLNADLRDGSLRQAAAEMGVPILVYEGGEALRFNEVAIRAGLKGVVEVMRALEMLPPSRRAPAPVAEPVEARSSTWVRAVRSGVLRGGARLGARVRKGGRLGVIADPFGIQEEEVCAPTDGIVIARLNLPLVNEGDALFHIARFRRPATVAARVAEFQNAHEGAIQDPDLYGGEGLPPE
jgi:predicted deacylase